MGPSRWITGIGSRTDRAETRGTEVRYGGSDEAVPGTRSEGHGLTESTPRRKRPRAVLFDFDFTLADSFAGILACATFALTRMGRPAPTPDAVRHTVGQSLPDSARDLGIADLEERERYRTLFLEHAARVMTASTVLYDGVPEMVEQLHAEGLWLGIVSTKTRVRIVDILTVHGLEHLFGCVIGGDDVEHPKPHPTALLRALEALGVSGADAVYVGDHVIDGQTAQAAGVPFVAVLTGVHDEMALGRYNPRVVISSVTLLPEVLADGG